MQRALDGIKILDLTQGYSGPHCTMLLADHGATVIKVEGPKGDISRCWEPVVDGKSGYYAHINRNKKGICIDLKTEKGKKLLLELAKKSDVLVENFTAGVMEKLGLGFEDIKKVKPDIIYASVSGFGLEGPMATRPAFDIVAQAMGGLMNCTGYPDGGPIRVGPSMIDCFAGTYLATGILAALRERDITGEPQRVDVPMLDSVFCSMENIITRYTVLEFISKRSGNLAPTGTPFEPYPTKDGSIIICCGHEAHFSTLARLMGRPDLIEDERYNSIIGRLKNRKGITDIINAWTSQFTTKEVEKMLIEADLPCGVIQDIPTLIDSGIIDERNMLWKVDQPGMGEICYPGNPIKINTQPDEIRFPAPLALGCNGEEILGEELGLSAADFAALAAEGVVRKEAE